jgi:hypothetical protein
VRQGGHKTLGGGGSFGLSEGMKWFGKKYTEERKKERKIYLPATHITHISLIIQI